ncbi:lysozyme inhibitor LprI family protein [Elstera sp.]|jgi:uncharacterized protein YecT (DUF1311 family)|uniref:lysozyme inhibitor LprI family protein n=1 Tax=Elstera sp. TaxID=1916664 RepID=UPI0037BF88A0
MIRFLIGLCQIFVVLPARAEDGPSFDCRKASTEIELMICALPSLAADDRDLNAAYTAALKRLPPAGQKILRDSQRDWLKALKIMCLNRVIPQSGKDGYNAECLSLKYREQAEYLSQKALITLPGGQTLIRRQQIAASDGWDYPRDPTTGACQGPDLCLGRLLAYYPAFAAPDLMAALPDGNIIGNDAPDPGESESDFEVIVANRNFLSIRQWFYWNSPIMPHGNGGHFTYTIDLHRARGLTFEAMFRPDRPWRSAITKQVIAQFPAESSEACIARPKFTPKQWDELIFADGKWHLTETELVFEFDQNAFASYRTQECTISLALADLKRFMTAEMLRRIKGT